MTVSTRWLVGAMALAVVGGFVSCSGGSDDTEAGPAPSTGATPTSTRPSTARPTTQPPATPPVPRPTRPARLQDGDRGPIVRELQQRLAFLRFWVGPADGNYGTLTEQAVFAFQKSNGLEIDGIVGPLTWAALDAPVVVTPQSRQGRVWEVDKSRQLLLLAVDGQVEWIWNTSTGTERPYTFQGEELLADTPTGRFTFTREVDGWDGGPLGDLYRPKYFHPDGIAIHGYGEVPPYPASHGCVRVTIPAIDFISANGLAPIGGAIRVLGRTPG